MTVASKAAQWVLPWVVSRASNLAECLADLWGSKMVVQKAAKTVERKG